MLYIPEVYTVKIKLLQLQLIIDTMDTGHCHLVLTACYQRHCSLAVDYIILCIQVVHEFS